MAEKWSKMTSELKNTREEAHDGTLDLRTLALAEALQSGREQAPYLLERLAWKNRTQESDTV